MSDLAAAPPAAAADAFDSLRLELAEWQRAGRGCPMWWRDDDLVSDTPALRTLAGFAARNQVPVLMAVIPAMADDSLAADTAEMVGLSFCQHGWEHRNHEPTDSLKSEFGEARTLEAMAGDLLRGRKRMLALFGRRFVPVFVPPWNRFRADALPLLPLLGLYGISQYRGLSDAAAGTSLQAVDCHLDILLWAAQPPVLCQSTPSLVRAVVAHLKDQRERRGADEPVQPLGILSHHRPMGDDAWAFMQQLVDVCREFSAVRWLSAAELFPPQASQ